jgi:hypothetical protein
MFTTVGTPGLTGVVALMRFGALTHRIDFSQPVTIRMPALGEAAGKSVSIYSSDKEDVFGTNDPAWVFEKTGTVANINGVPYVQFTTNHAGRYVLSDVAYAG